MTNYHGKRFVGLILSLLLLFFGYLYGPEVSFSAFSTAVGLVYGAFLTGQSATDWKEHGN